MPIEKPKSTGADSLERAWLRTAFARRGLSYSDVEKALGLTEGRLRFFVSRRCEGRRLRAMLEQFLETPIWSPIRSHELRLKAVQIFGKNPGTMSLKELLAEMARQGIRYQTPMNIAQAEERFLQHVATLNLASRKTQNHVPV